MKKAMIISVGGTPEPIIKSINTYRPDIVHFMPSQSSITQIGEITAKTKIAPAQIKTKILEDHQSLVSAFKGTPGYKFTKNCHQFYTLIFE